MIIPDINLLIFVHNKDTQWHKPTYTWWESVIHGNELVGISWIVANGFIRIMTHPKVMERPLRTDTACEVVEEWFSFAHIQPLAPGPNHLTIFKRCLRDCGVGGNLVTDAHIAALAMEFNGTVYSNDRDFGRFQGLKWKNPL